MNQSETASQSILLVMLTFCTTLKKTLSKRMAWLEYPSFLWSQFHPPLPFTILISPLQLSNDRSRKKLILTWFSKITSSLKPIYSLCPISPSYFMWHYLTWHGVYENKEDLRNLWYKTILRYLCGCKSFHWRLNEKF